MRHIINSSELEKRLKKLVQKQNEIEEKYRVSNQRFWTIMFVDVSSSAKKIWELGKKESDRILTAYQKTIRSVLEKHSACFIEPGGGPQIVCCFEDPEICLLSAQSILHIMKQDDLGLPKGIHLIPAIGIHQGYVNFHDGIIHQSNTNNITKRIQTEAPSGYIFVSREIVESLSDNPQFSFQLVGEFSLKNISELQEIYEVKFRILADMDGFSVQNGALPSSDELIPTGVRESHRWIVLYIDVCESTKKFWEYGDREASRLIAEYQKLCHSTFQKYGCAYVKSCEGDQIIAAFESGDANSAVISAIQIMKDLFRRNINVRESKQIHASIGLHLGEVILDGDSPVVTNDMRVGKAIQEFAESEEILLSKAVSTRLESQILKYIHPLGYVELPYISDLHEIDCLNWVHIQLRQSFLHLSNRRPGNSGKYLY
ncbi:MAG: hypothetical protein JXR73_06810 [Candidatus Omnitrophica bacterium]|nr:hypothetical protein [Candidatus Omnitrophota bacterium]